MTGYNPNWMDEPEIFAPGTNISATCIAKNALLLRHDSAQYKDTRERAERLRLSAVDLDYWITCKKISAKMEKYLESGDMDAVGECIKSLEFMRDFTDRVRSTSPLLSAPAK